MTERTVDPVTAYASAVVAGDVMAGPHVRASCQRHLDDLRDADGRGWHFDAGKVAEVREFYSTVLKFTSGSYVGKAFHLAPWQLFIVGSLFGWVEVDTGFRRFRRAYIETGKGSGKTPMVAGVALYMLLADGEARPEIYACARNEMQAGILIGEAAAMVRESADLSAVCRSVKAGVGQGQVDIVCEANGGVITGMGAASKKGAGKSGFLSHAVLADEYHEHPDSMTLDLLEAGIKSRTQPLTLIITNAGPGMDTPCWFEHVAARKIATGELDAPDQFSYVCALDDGDKPFDDRACWVKTNPTLPGTPGVRYIQGEIAKSRGLPSRRALVERLQFCIWGDVEAPWIDRDRVEAVLVDELDEARFACPAFLSLDLSMKRDLTAGAVVWRREDGTFDAELIAWTPGATMRDREASESIPFTEWVRAGFVRAVEGRAVIDYGDVAAWVIAELDRCDVRALVYDPWKMDTLRDRLEDEGVRTRREIRRGHGLLCIPHAQGFKAGAVGMARQSERGRRWRTRDLAPEDKAPALWMPRSIDILERCVLQGTIRIAYTPIWRWAAMGAMVVPDASNNRRFQKAKSVAIIDPLVALTMAVGAAEVYGDVLVRPRRPGYTSREKPLHSIDLRM